MPAHSARKGAGTKPATTTTQKTKAGGMPATRRDQPQRAGRKTANRPEKKGCGRDARHPVRKHSRGLDARASLKSTIKPKHHDQKSNMLSHSESRDSESGHLKISQFPVIHIFIAGGESTSGSVVFLSLSAAAPASRNARNTLPPRIL